MLVLSRSRLDAGRRGKEVLRLKFVSYKYNMAK